MQSGRQFDMPALLDQDLILVFSVQIYPNDLLGSKVSRSSTGLRDRKLGMLDNI